MKKIFTVLLVFCVTGYITRAQQCENALYNFKEGATWELTNFDKKGKAEGSSMFTISNISAVDSVLKGQLHKESYDIKNKQVGSADFNLQCINGNFMVDMEFVISEKQFESYRNSEFKVLKHDRLLFPKVMEIGAKLSNGQLSGEIDTQDGTKVGKVFYETTERLVLAKEKITVPAGTFECIKISTKINSATTIAGVNLNYDYVLVEWYAYGLGIIRSETYKKDKLEAYSVLAKFSK